MIARTGPVVVCAVALTAAVAPSASAGDDFEFVSAGELIAADLAPSYAGYVDLATFGQDDDGGDGDGLPEVSDITGEVGGAEYSEGDWHIWAAPYLWLPAIDGDATIAGITADIDMSFSDIWDNFDVFALSGRMEAWRKNQFGVVFDGNYLDLDGNFKFKIEKSNTIGLERELSGPRGLKTIDLEIEVDATILIDPDLDVNITMSQIDLAMGWRVLDKPISPDKGADSARITLDVIGGARYQYLKEKVNVKGTVTTRLGLSESFSASLGGSNDWIEPMIGGRVLFRLNDNWAIVVRGDASGFSVGSASSLTWNVITGVHYHFSEKFRLMAGYRVQGFDYETGSGGSRFGADWTVQGLYLGGGFTF